MHKSVFVFNPCLKLCDAKIHPLSRLIHFLMWSKKSVKSRETQTLLNNWTIYYDPVDPKYQLAI